MRSGWGCWWCCWSWPEHSGFRRTRYIFRISERYMANIIIQPWNQSAPEAKHDAALAREAAAAKDAAKAARTDWDRIDWEAGADYCALQSDLVQRRRRMSNKDFDAEFDAPGHHDPALALLEQRAYLETIEKQPEEWVE